MTIKGEFQSGIKELAVKAVWAIVAGVIVFVITTAKTDQKNLDQSQAVAQTLEQHSQQIRTIDDRTQAMNAQAKANEATLNDITNRLDRIENKIDRVAEEKGRH